MYSVSKVAIYAVLTLTQFISFRSVAAYSDGAGGCTEGQAAVGALHTRPGASTGSLEDGGYTLSLNGLPYSSYDAVALAAFVQSGLDVTVEVSGADFKGVLLRIGVDDVDLGAALIVDDPLFSVASNCPSDVGSITHTSSADKSSVTGTLNLDGAVSADTPLFLDITVVEENSFTRSAYFFTRFALGDFEVEDVTCGLFGLNFFCPLTRCGFFGRLFGLCK